MPARAAMALIRSDQLVSLPVSGKLRAERGRKTSSADGSVTAACSQSSARKQAMLAAGDRLAGPWTRMSGPRTLLRMKAGSSRRCHFCSTFCDGAR